LSDTTAKLTANQEKALVALLSKGTVREAAKASKVSEATLWRWLKLEQFQAEYRASRRELIEVGVSQLQSDFASAVKVLREIAQNKKAPSSARVTAAKIIIEQGIKGVELIDLEERINKLEELEQRRGKGKK
jgi:hypothetical protein